MGAWTIRYTWPSGHPYYYWEEDVGSVIPKRYLQTVCYVYPDERLANKGAASGATGFFVQHRHKFPGDRARNFVARYAVTNDHAIKDRETKTYFPNPAIRLNISGKAETIPTNGLRWIKDAMRDIAVLPLFDNDAFSHAEFLDTLEFAAEGSFSNEAIEMGGWKNYGLGDEVFMVGRLLDHDGREVNSPSIRTGIISMFPCAATEDEMLVECRSLWGYSGSPVFAGVSNLAPPTNYRTMSMIRLLGMNRGHAIANDTNTGMTFVVPSWRILELINSSEVLMESEKISEQEKKSPLPVKRGLDSAGSPKQKTGTGFELPVPTEDDFVENLKKATRKK
jgi:hypothetical protein